MAMAPALFRLGMDLDQDPSTDHDGEVISFRTAEGNADIHTETDVTAIYQAAADDADRKDHFIVKNGVEYAGTHLIVDLWGAQGINDLTHVEATLRRCVEAAKATLLHIHLHHFTPNDGISGVAVLAESHISIHSWPEREYAALDIFMCGDSQPHEAVKVLQECFTPERVVVTEHLRGSGE